MANSIASMKVTLSAPGPGGSTYTMSKNTLAKFKGSSVNSADVPASSTTPVDVSFGTVAVGATLVIVENNTDGDLAVKINGAAAASHKLPPGGVLALGQDDVPGGSPLLSIECTPATTDAGTIDSWVFGDPAVEA